MRAKKNEPLSNLRARAVRVMEKGTSITTATPSTPGTESGRIASSATLVEEIPPQQNKRQRIEDKQKENVDSRSFSVWDNAWVALARAQDTFTTEDMKVFTGVFAHEVVDHHLHKFVQVLYLCDFTFFFFSPFVLS